MSIKNISILSDKRLFPTVMNIIEGSNKVDTAVYTLENYIVNNIDLIIKESKDSFTGDDADLICVISKK